MADDGIIIPASNETLAVATRPKIAALLYDRVWGSPENSFAVPDEIRFYTNTDIEISYTQDDLWSPTMERLYKSKIGKGLLLKSVQGLLFDGRVRRELGASEESVVDEIMGIVREKKDELEIYSHIINDIENRDLSYCLSCCLKRHVNPVFISKIGRAFSYTEGNVTSVLISLENLQIIDEDKLTWEQVLEFRKDDESKKKYKQFLHWLDTNMISKSQSFIQDEITIKLENYENALKKHGIQTVIGTVEELLDYKSLAAYFGAGFGIGAATDPIWGMLSGTGLFISNICIKAARKMIEYKEGLTGANSEIAWVHQLKKWNR